MVLAVIAGESEAWALFPKQGCTLPKHPPPPAGHPDLASWPALPRPAAQYASTGSLLSLSLAPLNRRGKNPDEMQSHLRSFWIGFRAIVGGGCCCCRLLSQGVRCLGRLSRAQPGKPPPSQSWPARAFTQFLWYNWRGDAMASWCETALLILLSCYVAFHFLLLISLFLFRSVTDPWSLSQVHNSR